MSPKCEGASRNAEQARNPYHHLLPSRVPAPETDVTKLAMTRSAVRAALEAAAPTHPAVLTEEILNWVDLSSFAGTRSLVFRGCVLKRAGAESLMWKPSMS